MVRMKKFSRRMVLLAAAIGLLVACQEDNAIAPPPVVFDECPAASVLAKTTLTPLVCPSREGNPWRTTRPEAFAFTYTRHCFCPQDYVGPFLVTVHGDSVTSVRRVTHEGDTVALTGNLQSYHIDSIWYDVAVRLTRAHSSADVRYDTTYGFPDSLYIDQIQDAIDDEYGITIKNFRLLTE